MWLVVDNDSLARLGPSCHISSDLLTSICVTLGTTRQAPGYRCPRHPLRSFGPLIVMPTICATDPSRTSKRHHDGQHWHITSVVPLHYRRQPALGIMPQTHLYRSTRLGACETTPASSISIPGAVCPRWGLTWVGESSVRIRVVGAGQPVGQILPIEA